MDPRDLTKIRAFLGELLRDHDDHAAFADTESLINSGRLDSLAVVKLLSSWSPRSASISRRSNSIRNGSTPWTRSWP